MRPSQVQALLDDQITTPIRNPAIVLLEEIDGDDVVVRIQATPERAADGAKLADEIIAVLASVTGEHRRDRRSDRAPRIRQSPPALEPTGDGRRTRARADGASAQRLSR